MFHLEEQGLYHKVMQRHWHYEAITRADNLMMELLRIYLLANHIEIQSDLVYLER
jgi:hypothetical protein